MNSSVTSPVTVELGAAFEGAHYRVAHPGVPGGGQGRGRRALLAAGADPGLGPKSAVEIARFFAGATTYDASRDRFRIRGVMGPDEFHEAYPGAATPGPPPPRS